MIPLYVQELRWAAFGLAGLIAFGVFGLVTGGRMALQAPAGTFHGYACYGGCEGHRQGYAWAEQEAIADPARCRHISRAFSEGCLAWVRDGAKVAPAAP